VIRPYSRANFIEAQVIASNNKLASIVRRPLNSFALSRPHWVLEARPTWSWEKFNQAASLARQGMASSHSRKRKGSVGDELPPKRRKLREDHGEEDSIGNGHQPRLNEGICQLINSISCNAVLISVRPETLRKDQPAQAPRVKEVRVIQIPCLMTKKKSWWLRKRGRPPKPVGKIWSPSRLRPKLAITN